ncbi:MAG TPA: chemotaxis protein CheD [Spirochaetota bacterium]
MYVKGIHRYGKKIRLIYSGDFYVSGEDELIGTLLGSCVAVCLYDETARVGGMNHFMLPGKITHMEETFERSAKYGITAINELFAEMLRRGAEKHRTVAKLFGGGAVLEFENRQTAIPENNIRIARVMLEMEDIPIVEEDTGGKYIRKVFLDVPTGKVYLKKTLRGDMSHDDSDEIIFD